MFHFLKDSEGIKHFSLVLLHMSWKKKRKKIRKGKAEAQVKAVKYKEMIVFNFLTGNSPLSVLNGTILMNSSSLECRESTKRMKHFTKPITISSIMPVSKLDHFKPLTKARIG